MEEADFCEHGEWHLEYEDQFEGTTLDGTMWLTFSPDCMVQDECLTSRTHDWPHQLQIHMDENVQVTDHGTVTLTTRKGPSRSWYGASSVYSSGLLRSRVAFGKGRFECRCKVAKSTSHYLWPAFWHFGGGPNCCELDILEINWNTSDTYHHALHRYTYGCDGNHASGEGTHELIDLSEDFHVYRADRDKWYVDFYVDDELMYRACRI